MFGIFSILLPLSNRISGPISPPMTSENDSYLDQGNTSDFCGVSNDNATDTSINMDSVSRIPARVWVVIIVMTSSLVLSRYIYVSTFFRV